MMVDGEFIRRIEKLKFNVWKALSGRREGDRPLDKGGGAIDFRAYHAYVPGDEFRYIDWNLFARTGQLHVKEFTRDQGITVSVVLDNSPSMGFGAPTKLEYAKTLAGLFGAVALNGANTFKVAPLLGRGPAHETFAGRGDFQRALKIISSISLSDALRSDTPLEASFPRGNSREYMILLSDLWNSGRLRQPLKVGSAAGNQFAVVHMLSVEERAPLLKGKVRLLDCETGERAERFVGEEEVEEYRRLLDEHTLEWKRFCADNGIRYVGISNDMAPEEAFLVSMRTCNILE